MANNYNPTTKTWGQVANKQAYDALSNIGNINSNTLITEFDPIYGKLVGQISNTIYRKLSVTQRMRTLGLTNPASSYPGIIREIQMRQRKGRNFGMDFNPRPTTMLNYDIINDEIDTRYHSMQVRWMYGYTIFDEELRRFSGGNGITIGELTEMKAINMASARNMFMDTFRKKLLSLFIQNVAKEFTTGIDLSDFDNLTVEDAHKFLNIMDNLFFVLSNGTTLYNTDGKSYYIQTPIANLQMVMPYSYYQNLIRRAYPNTFNPSVFKNILPSNILLIDDLGTVELTDSGGNAIVPSFDAKGMNLENWTDTSTYADLYPELQAVIMDKSSICFEDNLNETLIGQKDIEKLCTPVRSHYWTRGYYTDLLSAVKILA